MKHGSILLAKTLAVWAMLLIGAMLGNLLVQPEAPVGGDGPLTSGQAFLLVNGLAALVLAALASRLSGTFAMRAATLFLALFLVEAGLSMIEAYFFNSFVKLPFAMLVDVTAVNAIRSALAALAAAALWAAVPVLDRPSPIRLWQLPAVVLLYILLYFGAGQFIAWQSSAVRAYYGDGIDIAFLPLVSLQVVRGAIWTGIALLLVRGLAVSRCWKALLIGTTFAVLMVAPMLYPNTFMSWPVRMVHSVEILVSNFLFGLLAAWLLSIPRDPSLAAEAKPL